MWRRSAKCLGVGLADFHEVVEFSRCADQSLGMQLFLMSISVSRCRLASDGVRAVVLVMPLKRLFRV